MRRMVRHVRMKSCTFEYSMTQRLDEELGVVWDGSVRMLRNGTESVCTVQAVTSRQTQAKTVLDLLAQACVTPVSFREVLEDLAADGMTQILTENRK